MIAGGLPEALFGANLQTIGSRPPFSVERTFVVGVWFFLIKSEVNVQVL